MDEPKPLVDIDEEAFRQEYGQIVSDMVRNGSWYRLAGSYKGGLASLDFRNAQFEELPRPHHLGLGRSSYYDSFLRDLGTKLGYPVYQSDYMLWISPGDPYESLTFYIRTAEAIHFSLRGIDVQQLRKAVDFGRAAVNRADLGTRYMTMWELNQLFHSDDILKATWYVTPKQSIDAVRQLLKPRVPPGRVLIYRPGLPDSSAGLSNPT